MSTEAVFMLGVGGGGIAAYLSVIIALAIVTIGAPEKNEEE